MTTYASTHSATFYSQYDNVESLASVSRESGSAVVKFLTRYFVRDNSVGGNGWSW